MKFSELHPMLHQSPEFGHQLVMSCPHCKARFGIRVSLDGKEKAPATWGLILPENVFSWDAVTITPSINQHPTPRNVQRTCHFSVTKGEVLP